MLSEINDIRDFNLTSAGLVEHLEKHLNVESGSAWSTCWADACLGDVCRAVVVDWADLEILADSNAIGICPRKVSGMCRKKK